ncbi:MAG TPA: tRNA 2-selenouridine(34) synthase MnmH [Burkholderiales bacterium]|nr:tRNA 2-selenouridine(34) synthase MnmH [Burkholderiales bacterium]
MKILSSPTLAQLSEFDEIVDVRSPSEFGIDHIPGAISCPVLDDEERARVGTIYVQESPFLAKKIGAAIVSRNIACHLEVSFVDKPKSWRPLVYCWRGGKRSGAMAHVLSEIGWKTARLEGGYKAYRRSVLESLEILPLRFDFRVICGVTGCGKSRLLDALSKIGEQVLDLEKIACHRGSLLGKMPGIEQPGQKYFESNLWFELSRLDPERPVYIESESSKIGNLRVPQKLMEAMWKSSAIRLEAEMEARRNVLFEDYRHYFDFPDALKERLECLTALHGRETIDAWKSMIEGREWTMLVESLLLKHYDKTYLKSLSSHYRADAPVYDVTDSSESGFIALARKIQGV